MDVHLFLIAAHQLRNTLRIHPAQPLLRKHPLIVRPGRSKLETSQGEYRRRELNSKLLETQEEKENQQNEVLS